MRFLKGCSQSVLSLRLDLLARASRYIFVGEFDRLVRLVLLLGGSASCLILVDLLRQVFFLDLKARASRSDIFYFAHLCQCGLTEML